MAIAFNSTTNRLTLTGGTSGARLSLLNVINDATVYSSGVAYSVGQLVKADASDSNGLSLWSANSAFTSNTPTLNTAQWTWRGRIIGGVFTSNNYTSGSILRLNAHLDIGAFLDSTNQDQIYFEDGFFIRCANGCNWLDGQNGASGLLISYSNIGNNTSANVCILQSTSASDQWVANRVTFRTRDTTRSDIVLAPSNSTKATMLVNINTINIDSTDGASVGGTANNIINISATSTITNIREIRTNLTLDPVGVSNLTHSGIQEAGIFTNKIGILNSSKTNPLNGYAPDIRNYTAGQGGIGLINPASDQTFRDWIVSDNFTYSGNLTVYNGVDNTTALPLTSAWTQRTVNLTFRQGITNITANARFTPTIVSGGSPAQTINAVNANITNGALIQVLDTFYGSRATQSYASASYATFSNFNQATTWNVLVRNQTHLDTTAQYNFAQGNTGGSFSSPLSAILDTTYTSDQSALTTISANATNSTVTTTGNLTEDQMYDWMKWWLSQSAQLQSVPVTPMSPSGNVLSFGNWNFSFGGVLNAGTKLNSLTTTGNITLSTLPNVAGNYASLRANNISLPGSLTLYQSVIATAAITNLLAAGTIASGVTVGFGTSTAISMSGDASLQDCSLSGVLSLNNSSAGTTKTLSIIRGTLTGNLTITGSGAGAIQVATQGLSLNGFTLTVNGTATQVNSVTVNIDTSSYGGNILLITTGGTIVNTNTVIPTTGSSYSIVYPTNPNVDRVIIGNAGRVPKATSIVNGSIDATGLQGTQAGVIGDDPWTTTFTSGITTFSIPTSQTGSTAGVQTAGRAVARFGDVALLQGVNAALTAGFTLQQFINNNLSDTITIQTNLLQFVSSVNTQQRTLGGIVFTGDWYVQGGTGNKTSGVSGALGVPQVAVPLNNQSASIGDVYTAEVQVVNTTVKPWLIATVTVLLTAILSASLLIPPDTGALLQDFINSIN